MRMYRQLFLVISLLVLMSCASIKRGALHSVADGMMGGGDSNGNSLTKDDDFELVAGALPTFLKVLEMLIDADPSYANSYYGAGQAFIMYANAFVQKPAEQNEKLTFEEKQKAMKRALRFYIRGRDYLFKGLDIKFPNFFTLLENPETADELLKKMKEKDIPFLYWGALGYLGVMSLDPVNPKYFLSAYKPFMMLYAALKLNENYSNGALHSILYTILHSLPSAYYFQALQKSPEVLKPFLEEYYGKNSVSFQDSNAQAEFHLNKAIEFAQGKSPSLYITLAQREVGNGSKGKFIEYLNKALAVDPHSVNDTLETVIYQREASYLLKNIDNLLFVSE